MKLTFKRVAMIVGIAIVALPLTVFLLARWFSSDEVAEIRVASSEPNTIGCLSTTFRWFGPTDKVCVEGVNDPRIPGVACHVSQARTGGWLGAAGLRTDVSMFSIACRQIGPITLPANLPHNEAVFTTRTSLLFKTTDVFRMYDPARKTLVYMALSTRVTEGSPNNSISSVPIMPWRE